MPEHRRKLPHFHPEGTLLFLTWRLRGSLPAKPATVLYASPGHAFVAQHRALDTQASGPRWLRNERIADLVAEAMLIGDHERHFYEPGAWVVMPNHVHLLIRPMVAVPVLMPWL